jgi:hypothetical protein
MANLLLFVFFVSCSWFRVVFDRFCLGQLQLSTKCELQFNVDVLR